MARQGKDMSGNYPQGQWPPQQQPQQWPPQPQQQQWPPQQPYSQQQVQPWQQPYPPQPYGPPRMAVTRKPISFAEHIFHFCMCFPTCGLWIFVWISRAAAKRKETTYYR